MPLTAAQEKIAKSNHRFRVVVAGRRVGKSTMAIREMCKYARIPNQTVWAIYPTYRMARTIIFKRLKDKLMDLRWVKKINETNLEFTLKNGSIISLKGADTPDSLRGSSLSAAIFDEFAFMDEETWMVIRPALADQQGPALFLTTPIGKSNWAFDLYNMEEKYPEQWKSFTFTTAQGGLVPEDEIEAARNDMSEQQFKQEFEASFITASNLVAWAFTREHNLKHLDKPDLRQLHIGVDFNNSPITAAIYVQHGEEMYQIDEVHMLNSHTQELADEILRRYPQSRITVYPDPSGRQRKTSAGGATDFTILESAGFTVKAPFKHDPVRDRINSYNARLCSATGHRRLFIDPKCRHTIESLEKFCFKPGTQIPDKGEFDHMFDAASYAIQYMWPLRKETPEFRPQRWTHRMAA